MTNRPRSGRGLPRAAGALLALVTLVLSSAAQERDTAGRAGTKAQPKEEAVVSVEALLLGLKLKESASPDLKKWAERRAASDPGRSAESLDQLAEDVRAGFAAASAPQRAALAYLVLYLAYESATNDHLGIAGELRNIDRDLRNYRRQAAYYDPMSRPSAANPEAVRRAAEGEHARQQVLGLEHRRGTVVNAEAEARKRVDGYLVLLNKGFSAVGKSAGEQLKGLRPSA